MTPQPTKEIAMTNNTTEYRKNDPEYLLKRLEAAENFGNSVVQIYALDSIGKAYYEKWQSLVNNPPSPVNVEGVKGIDWDELRKKFKSECTDEFRGIPYLIFGDPDINFDWFKDNIGGTK
jgi:hypothetical protein